MMDDHYPRVNQISSSPVEPIFVCAGSSKQSSAAALVAWSMKTMSACVSSVCFCCFIYALLTQYDYLGYISIG